MELTMYQVDAFTERVFGGNPAAVCPLKTHRQDRLSWRASEYPLQQPRQWSL